VQVAQELGCLTPQTWLAHGVHFNPDDVAVLRRCGCGICHCPSSNMRLGSGIAPVRHYLDQAITVGLGVDGSASNDSSNLLSEIRTAVLLSRLAAEDDASFLGARTVLEMATRTERSSWGAMTSVAWHPAVRRTSSPSTAAESKSRVRRTPSLHSHSAP